ncbi:hypothetical protein ASA1KI_20860 [Opitutales bacterium ASA1]|uniref:carbohydrate-binding protein n=1 Tax=Congregicoccus parvus TaxID=3081749 RepID=UPI002B2E6951|nr:hypothetical protein ASA1KI_20860 [Opitutales bacterium ASA1]
MRTAALRPLSSVLRLATLCLLPAVLCFAAAAAEIPPLPKSSAVKAVWMQSAADLHALAVDQAERIGVLEAQLQIARELAAAIREPSADDGPRYAHVTWRYVDADASGDYRYLRKLVPVTEADWLASDPSSVVDPPPSEPADPLPSDPPPALRTVRWEAESDAGHGRGGEHPLTEPGAHSTAGLHIAYWRDGEWLEYPLPPDLPAGPYTLRLRVATPSPAAVTVSTEGTDLARVDIVSTVLPATGGWGQWADLEASITLPPGARTLRLTGSAAYWVANVDSVELVQQP